MYSENEIKKKEQEIKELEDKLSVLMKSRIYTSSFMNEEGERRSYAEETTMGSQSEINDIERKLNQAKKELEEMKEMNRENAHRFSSSNNSNKYVDHSAQLQDKAEARKKEMAESEERMRLITFKHIKENYKKTHNVIQRLSEYVKGYGPHWDAISNYDQRKLNLLDKIIRGDTKDLIEYKNEMYMKYRDKKTNAEIKMMINKHIKGQISLALSNPEYFKMLMEGEYGRSR